MDAKQEVDRGTVERHYAELLAPVYVWMVGGAEAGLARARQQLAELDLRERAPGLAVDLGAGPGFHARALAEAGFEVLAIDGSDELLADLEGSHGELRIQTRRGDLGAFERELGGQRARVIACLGDTLTHLETPQRVDELLGAARRALAPGGALWLGFRDYSHERRASECLIPVRREAERVFTCALDFEPERVLVTDILHEWRDGRWIERRSSYPKLRLAPARVRARLAELGFVLEHDTSAGGLVTLLAAAP